MPYNSWFWAILTKRIVTMFSKPWDFIRRSICVSKLQSLLFQLTLPPSCNFWTKKASCELIVMIYTGNKHYSPSFYAGNQSHYAIHFIMGKKPRRQIECYALSHAITRIVYQWSLVLCSNYLVKWTNCKWACGLGLIRCSCFSPQPLGSHFSASLILLSPQWAAVFVCLILRGQATGCHQSHSVAWPVGSHEEPSAVSAAETKCHLCSCLV